MLGLRGRLVRGWLVFILISSLIPHSSPLVFPLLSLVLVKCLNDFQIKIKSNALPVRYTHDGLIFTDNTFLKADIIVFATGFQGNMRNQVNELFGKEIGDLVGDYWTLDEEGELKGAVRPVGRKSFALSFSFDLRFGVLGRVREERGDGGKVRGGW